MTRYELVVDEWLRKNRWEVMRNGWPDFLCSRKNSRGPRGTSIMAIEVKSSTDKLSDA
jgi:hypothetical protein